jgi:hypothetical protein
MTAVSAIEPTSARNCQKSDDHRTSPIRWLDLICLTRMLPEINLKCLACSHQVAFFRLRNRKTSGLRAINHMAIAILSYFAYPAHSIRHLL